MYDPDKDLALSMRATSKLSVSREVALIGKSPYWLLRNQFMFFGLGDTEGAKHILGLLSAQAEAAVFAKADILERVAPLVADLAIKFTAVDAEETEAAMAHAGGPPAPDLVNDLP